MTTRARLIIFGSNSVLILNLIGCGVDQFISEHSMFARGILISRFGWIGNGARGVVVQMVNEGWDGGLNGVEIRTFISIRSELFFCVV